MAVSKRLRYEILRRDNHACRYCGATAPDAKLTVDHVVPTALGGSDDPDNLVTACSACNSGKTSSSPDAPIVADVKQDALRWSQAMEHAADVQRQRRRELTMFQDSFEVAWWDSFTSPYWIDSDRTWWNNGNPDRKYQYAIVDEDDRGLELFDEYADAKDALKRIAIYPELPARWPDSVAAWFSAGLRIVDVVPLMRTVAAKDSVYKEHKWRYFCGCVWTLVKQRQEIAQALLVKQEEDARGVD